MFSDRDADSSVAPAFPSDWRKALSLKTDSTQTDSLKYAEADSQTNVMQEVGVQAQEPPKVYENGTLNTFNLHFT